MTKLDELTEQLAAQFEVQTLGSGASVFLNFVHPEDEALQLPVQGEPAARSTEVAQLLVDLVQATASSQDEELLARAIELPPRASAAYTDLLETLAKGDVDAAWLARDRGPVVLPANASGNGVAVLQQTSPGVVRDRRVEGRLYQLNSDSTKFRLRPKGKRERVIIGTFTRDVEPALRDAWGKMVVAEVRFIESVRLRSGEPVRSAYELTGIHQILAG